MGTFCIKYATMTNSLLFPHYSNFYYNYYKEVFTYKLSLEKSN